MFSDIRCETDGIIYKYQWYSSSSVSSRAGWQH